MIYPCIWEQVHRKCIRILKCHFSNQKSLLTSSSEISKFMKCFVKQNGKKLFKFDDFFKFVVFKGRGRIPFYTKWREIISVSQTCFIRKRKIRERKEERQILVLPKIEWEIMKCLNNETQCIYMYLTYILINESFDSWTATYMYLAIF